MERNLSMTISYPLQANSVDFYINGHDHCLEHISSKNRLASICWYILIFSSNS
jgi:hypothetical protein